MFARYELLAQLKILRARISCQQIGQLDAHKRGLNQSIFVPQSQTCLDRLLKKENNQNHIAMQTLFFSGRSQNTWALIQIKKKIGRKSSADLKSTTSTSQHSRHRQWSDTHSQSSFLQSLVSFFFIFVRWLGISVGSFQPSLVEELCTKE